MSSAAGTVAEGLRQVRLADARLPHDEHVVAALYEGAGGEFEDLRLSSTPRSSISPGPLPRLFARGRREVRPHEGLHVGRVDADGVADADVRQLAAVGELVNRGGADAQALRDLAHSEEPVSPADKRLKVRPACRAR